MQSRNNGSPIQGIDTLCENWNLSESNPVEIMEARYRALTHLYSASACESVIGRNDGSPFEGINIKP